jgi:Ser/Thr protein kinase RdoA (MazF antagonist)
VYLDSIGMCVPTSELDRHDMTELAIEDLCWCIAMAAWVDGRPTRRRRRARAQWRAEGEQLRARRQELAKMAGEAGIWP